jgi:hydrogenase nickel incorporation protein HypA/HybF
MHELGIASSILDAVRQESQIRNGARVLNVGVRIGDLAAVDPDSLRFGFEALVHGTDLEPLTLNLELCGGTELEFSYMEIEDEPDPNGTQNSE